MIQILTLPDPERFLSVVNQSQGTVFLCLPDHSRVNLKESRIAQQIIRLMKSDQCKLLLDVDNPRDVPSFMRFLSESAVREEGRAR